VFLATVRRTKFFKELSKEKKIEYFSLKQQKYLPNIDNIYYNIYLFEDINGNERLIPFFDELKTARHNFIETRNEIQFRPGLYIRTRGHKLYNYALSTEGEFDIFITENLLNENTPRVHVQLRAHGLWVNGIHEMLIKSYLTVVRIFSEYGCKIEKVRENRIDFCYHTNNIQKPGEIFDKRYFTRHMRTTFHGGVERFRLEKHGGDFDIITHYVGMGERKSNNVFVRFYDKTKEVVEMGYKAMFIPIWRENGLINAFDEYCLRYAYEHKSYAARHKARLLFYMEHGTDEATRQSIRLVLDDKNATAYHYRACAKKEGIPEVTIVTNIEFQTMRKFYYSSEQFIIDMLKHIDRPNAPSQLTHLFKIIDNRKVFIDYLTGTTVCFVKEKLKDKAPGEIEICCDWWERLRKTKLDGIKPDKNLIREYSAALDQRQVARRMIGAVATHAVYDDDVETDFTEDITDFLTRLNDNDIHAARINIIGEIKSDLLDDYDIKKKNKEVRVRSKKRKAAQKRAVQQLKSIPVDHPKTDAGEIEMMAHQMNLYTHTE